MHKVLSDKYGSLVYGRNARRQLLFGRPWYADFTIERDMREHREVWLYFSEHFADNFWVG